jgi:TatD DNase family protein
MTPLFIDTHAHLDYPDFSAELPQVISRAHAAGIDRIISIGTDLDSSRRAISIAEKHDSVFAAVGWHPSGALDAPDDIRPALRDLAKHPKVVAIGETGLDHFRLPSQKTGDTREDQLYKVKQESLFRQHLEVAAESGLNAVVHEREALDAAIAILQGFHGRVRGVFHCFVGDLAAAERIFELDGLVSFTGIITFKNAQSVRQTLAEIPLDKMMLETDAPFLAPVPHRGRRCEPAFVRATAEAAAAIKKCSLEALSDASNQTAARFFRKTTKGISICCR